MRLNAPLVDENSKTRNNKGERWYFNPLILSFNVHGECYKLYQWPASCLTICEAFSQLAVISNIESCRCQYLTNMYIALKNDVSNKPSKMGANPTSPKMFFSFKTCSNLHRFLDREKHPSFPRMRPSAFSTTCGSKESKTCNLGLTAPGEPRVDVMETKRGGKMEKRKKWWSTDIIPRIWMINVDPFCVFCVL